MKSYSNIKSFKKPAGIIINSLRLILFTLVTFYISEIFAQEKYTQSIKTDSIGYINVNGYVEKNNKPLENASITVFETNKKIVDKKTSSDGKFNLKFGFNRYFKVEITKPGLVLKKFEFDTHLPDSINNKGIYPFDFTIVLFPKYKDIDMSIFDKPLAIIKYSNQYQDFFYDYKYSKSINDKANLIQNKIEGLTSEYAKCIDNGNKLYESKQYKEALVKFKRAHEIFPDESEPVNKIDSINKIIKEEKTKR